MYPQTAGVEDFRIDGSSAESGSGLAKLRKFLLQHFVTFLQQSVVVNHTTQGFPSFENLILIHVKHKRTNWLRYISTEVSTLKGLQRVQFRDCFGAVANSASA